MLSGAESWNDIADYGKAKQEWLKTFLTLPGGIPSHDTFNRVFAALEPLEMEKGFIAWVSSKWPPTPWPNKSIAARTDGTPQVLGDRRPWTG